MQKIIPCLWFNDTAEEAVAFYVSVFHRSRIGRVTRYGEAGAAASGRPKGTVMTMTFQLEGQSFMALNGGPTFTFTEAISLVVDCKTQHEIDTLTATLSAGGEQGPCGWVKDRYGLSWQIVPAALSKMMQDKDPEKTDRVMKALLQMQKLDLATLTRAHRGKT